MGVQQYIGSRYVPIFGRKGESSILWDNTKPYEPLSIVLHQGNSYTSRQYVPIGIDIRNEEFWALTGNYNAQVEQYRQEVRSFDGRITANATAIEEEANARAEADTALQTAIDNEVTARTNADTTLQTAIDNEATARTNADTALQTAIDNEATARTNADTALQTAIDIEATARVASDTDLRTAIDTEATARANADTALDARIDELENATQTDILPLIDDLQKSERYHKCIVLGDSWCKGFYGGSEHPSSALGNLVAQKIGIDSANIVNKAINATGFLTGITFNQQFTNCTAEELADVDLVLIIGGQNDSQQTDPGACKAAVVTLFTNITNKLPDADVHVFPMPFAYGRTFGTDNSEAFGTIGSSGTYAMYTGIREAINTLQDPNRIYMHDGCHRWAWSMGAGYSDDAWHLTAQGYACWASIAAMCIRGNCDWWPTRVDVFSGLGTPTTIQRDVVYEANGIINAILIAQANAAIQAGQVTMQLPAWCMSGITRWIPNVSPGNGAALSLERGLHDGKVLCTFNMDNIPNEGWIMISFSWPAGL